MYSTGCEWSGCTEPDSSKVSRNLRLEDVTCGPNCLDTLSPASTGLDNLSPASSRSNSSQASHPCIIFDWDDTLFCSTAAAQSQWTWDELQELEETARSILNAAMCLGETFIVTNGVSTWVQDSARRFLPGLLPTIARLPVISARALYEKEFPGDPYMWKRATFHKLLLDHGQIYEDGLNLVAIGDQRPEILAAQGVVRLLGHPSKVKTVKLKEAPTVRELVGQLLKLQSEMVNIVGARDSCDLCLQPQLEYLDRRLNCATVWKIEEVVEDQGGWVLSKLLSLASIKDMIAMFS